jgi:tyrosine-protein kinase
VEPGELSEQAGGVYLRAVRRHWLLVAFVALFTTAVTLLTVSRAERTYEASAYVLVNPVPASDPTFLGTGVVADTGDPARTVQTAAALIDSPEAAAAAARTMGAGLTGQQIESSTSVTPRGQSNVLAVTARAARAEQAAAVASAFAQAAVETRADIVQRNIKARISALQSRIARLSRTLPSTSPELQDLTAQLGQLHAAQDTGGDPTLSVSQEARPGSPTGAPTWLVLFLAVAAGLALGSVAALGLDYFSPRIQDPSEVANLLAAPILAVVPKVRAARNGALPPASLPPVAFEQVRMLRAQIPRHRNGSAIMITSADARDGKTTVAAALAAAYAEGDQDVILLDLDLRAPAVARLLALENRSGDLPAIDWTADLRELLVPVPGFPRLKALATHPRDFRSIETLIKRLPALLAEARQLADWVIVDTPPIGDVSDAVRIAGECDEVLVVVRSGHTDRSRLTVVRDVLARIDVIPAGTVLVGQRGTTVSGQYYAYGYAQTKAVRESRSLRRIQSDAAADSFD